MMVCQLHSVLTPADQAAHIMQIFKAIMCAVGVLQWYGGMCAECVWKCAECV